MDSNRVGARATVVQHENAQTARKLVIWSHILGWGGLAILLVGSVIGGRIAGGTGAAVGVGIGLVSAVTGALLGQVGRGMQGRVV